MAEHGRGPAPTDPDVRREVIETARRFVARDVIPVATELERTDQFPTDLVARMRELGLFGITIPPPMAGSASTCRPMPG